MKKKTKTFRERSPLYLFHVLSLCWGEFLSPLTVLPLFLFLLFSFSFKSLSANVIFRFLAEKSYIVEKFTGHLWNLLFCIWSFESKSTGRGKIHQALVEHAILNPALLKPNLQSWKIHQAPMEHVVLNLTNSILVYTNNEQTQMYDSKQDNAWWN